MVRPILPNRSEQTLTIDRRRLLASAAVITMTGIAPGIGPANSVKTAQADNVTSTPTSKIPAWNICFVTARRIEEIAKRNRIREEARLPLLPLAKELRRMKDEADAIELRKFAAFHCRAMWDEVLRPIRDARGGSNWQPNFMEAMTYQSHVNKVLHERFNAARSARSDTHPSSSIQRQMESGNR